MERLRKEKSENKGRVPTEMELELELTQQGSSYEVLKHLLFSDIEDSVMDPVTHKSNPPNHSSEDGNPARANIKQALGSFLGFGLTMQVVLSGMESLKRSPDQTVSGKDSSNPLMADNFLKIVWYLTYHVALMKGWLVQKQTGLGVNTPRSDEDRLELMELTIFLLPKVKKVGVEVSAVDLQFWTTVAVKKVNDVTRLQALVDKRKVVVTEASIRDALRLDDAEGVECLPNEEMFVELARMGYEKPSTKLTFYKAFFSSQWKFLIHTILQRMSAKRTSWNEFSSSMASAVICLSSGRKFNFSKKQVGNLSTHTIKYTSPALTQKVFANMRRVGKGFSGVKTPLFEGMIVEQQVAEGVVDEVHDEGVPTAGIVAEGDVSATNDEVPTVVEEPSIPSPTPHTLPPQPSHDIPSTS
nr:hypothetical protein [Tanacetum cinerariifolium]